MGFKKSLKNISKVWKITKKPSKKEYMQVVKISLIGFLIIGLFGFIVDMLWLGVLKNLFK